MAQPESNALSELQTQLIEWEEASKQLSKQIGLAKKQGDTDIQTLIDQKKQLQTQKINPLKERISTLTSSEPSSKASQPAEDCTIIAVPEPYLGGDTQNTPHAAYTFSITELNEQTDTQRWDDFVQSHPMGGLYYESTFLHSIKNSLGHRIFLLQLLKNDNQSIQAILPIVEQKSVLFGHLWTSIALVNYGGVLSHDAQTEERLLQHAQREAKQAKVKRLEIRGLYRRPIHWPVSTEKASMWLTLPENHNADDLLASFKAKLRSQIKKGYTDKVECRTGHLELLNDYYQIFARNMRDLGTPVYSKTLFKTLLNDLGENAQLVLVYHEGKPASAAFLIKNRDTMEIPWASTIRDFNPYNLNMVLYWEVLKYSCQSHCKLFDFGRSSIDAPTYKFKKQWGAQPVQHYWYSFEQNQVKQTIDSTRSKATTTENPKFQLLIKIWQRLPLWLANLMGPHIVKYIP